jgi:formate dehydrogenase subunit delta
VNTAKLIKMANQIGAFFDAMPDREQAVNDVATHISRHWEPRMRAALARHLVLHGDAELMPIVRHALPLLDDFRVAVVPTPDERTGRQ